MSNSTVVEWLNENAQRCYPLLETSPRMATVGSVSLDLLPLILDASLFYTNLPNSVTLNSIQTSGGDLTITIAGQDPFVITGYVAASYPKYVRNNAHSLLVVGDASTIPGSLTFNITGAEFEPSTAIEIFDSTRGVNQITIQGEISTGAITLTEGYQMSITPNGHRITLEAGRNEGHPLPCATFFENDNDCSTVASFVNGASPDKTGNAIKLEAGNHIKIFEDIDNNRLYVGYDFVATDVSAQILPKPIAII